MLNWSLILGLLAWILPLLSSLKPAKGKDFKNESRLYFTIISLSFCAFALFFAVIDLNHMAGIKDWAGLEDTSVGYLFGSAVLLTVTIVLNIINLLVYRKNKVN